MGKTSRILLAFSLSFFGLQIDSLIAGPCAMCKNSLALGGSSGLLMGFYWSILLIAGVPAVILSIAGVVVYKIWKTEKGTPSD